MDFQQFNGQHWSRTIPETYAAFAKSAAVLEATPMPEAKMMPRLLREIVETILDIHLDLGNWLQGFLPWEVPDGLYTTIAPNCFAIVRDLANHYPKSKDVALVRKLMSAFAEFAQTKRPFPALTPDDEANLRFCCRTIIEGYTAKLYPAYWNLVRWVCRNPFRFLTALRIVRRHRHLRLNPPPHPSAEDWKRTNEILSEKLEFLCAVGRESQRMLTTIRNTQRRNALLTAEARRTPECDRWCYDRWNALKGRIDIIEAPVNKSKVFDFLCRRETIRTYLADHGITLSRHFSTAVDNGRKAPPIGTETPWK